MLLVKCWWKYHLGNCHVLFLGVNLPNLFLLFARFLIFHLEVCWDRTLPTIEIENSLVELTPGYPVNDTNSIRVQSENRSQFHQHFTQVFFVWKQANWFLLFSYQHSNLFHTSKVTQQYSSCYFYRKDRLNHLVSLSPSCM